MNAYGMAAWPARLAPIPRAHESAIIARVQSMRTRGGKRAEPLSFAESQAYLRRVDRVLKRNITVPPPREPVAHAGTPAGTVRAAPASVQAAGNVNASLRSDCAQPPPVAAARAGAPSTRAVPFPILEMAETGAGRSNITKDAP